MYVCICKGITEKQIKSSVSEGASSVRDLYQNLALGSQCGKCVSFARQLISEETSKSCYYDASQIA